MVCSLELRLAMRRRRARANQMDQSRAIVRPITVLAVQLAQLDNAEETDLQPQYSSGFAKLVKYENIFV